jgi:transcriptional regulator with XRE-family HTH domain
MKLVTTPRAANFDRLLGANIRRERTLRGLSQQDLAQAIGVTYQQAHKYEVGTNRISAARLHLIANVLGLPLDALVPKESATAQPAPERDRLGLEMARNFARIADPARRQAISQLVGVLAGESGMETEVSSSPSWSMAWKSRSAG